MRLVYMSMVALCLLGTAAQAEDMDFSVIKCKDFIAADKSEISIILAWLEGYYTKENDPPVLHSEKMMTDAKNLAGYCAAHGSDGLVTAAEAVMPVK